MAARLPPLLSPGLAVVFVGTEPGAESLATGCYYANPRNSFWSDIHLAGFTPTRLDPCDFRTLLGYGVGLDDVSESPRSLGRRLEAVRPRAVCFNSKNALRRFCGREIGRPWRGEDAARWASMDGVALIWAIPDSSGRASGHHRERLALLGSLRQRLDGATAS